MILTKSPHYINIPLSYGTTYSVTLKLFIWAGEKANVPIEPTYTITKERPDVAVTQLDVEISDLVNDYIDNQPEIKTTTGKYATLENNGLWVKWVISYNDDIETLADDEGTDFAIGGYGYYLEGINPQPPKILTGSTVQKVDDVIVFPYLSDGTLTTLTVTDGTTTQTYSLADEQDTKNRLGYLWINTLDFNGDVTIDDGVSEWYYEVVTECKYTPEKILFLNRYGAYEVFTFFKAKKESIKVESETFNNAFVKSGAYDIRHQRQKYNTQAEETFTLNTDYLPEEENERVKQLLQSESVWLINGQQLIPVNVKTDSLELKTRINDKLINYSLDFEYAFNRINQV